MRNGYANGLGDPNNHSIVHLTEFNGNLYASTNNWDNTLNNTHGGQILRSSNGLNWTSVVTQGFGDPTNGEIDRFAVFNNQICASTESYTTTHGAEIWCSSTGNSGDWTRAATNGFGNANNSYVGALETFNGYLYAGTANWNRTTMTTTGSEVWRTNNGITWTQVSTSGFGTTDNNFIAALKSFNGYLYASPGSLSGNGAQVWRCQACDNSDWTKVVDNGFGNVGTHRCSTLEVFDGRLYCGVDNDITGMEVWRTTDGTNWNQVGFAGFGDSNNTGPGWYNSVAVFNNRLYIGTLNSANSGEIWRNDVVETAINPSVGGTLVYTGALSLPTTVITVPADATTAPITLTYTPLQIVTPPASLGFAGYAFDLDAYQNGSLLLGVEFSTPVTITLRYTDADVAGMSEANLKLYTYSGGAWQDATCGAYDRHPDQNWLSAPICHLSRFALMGNVYKVYLPVVMRN